jgi:hypothetical protein
MYPRDMTLRNDPLTIPSYPPIIMDLTNTHIETTCEVTLCEG